MNKIIQLTLLVVCFYGVTPVIHAADADTADNSMQQLLNDYYQKYKDKEYFSGAEMSVYIPGKPIENYYVGHESHDKDSKKVSAITLFEIGSISKSFTSATVLRLIKAGKLGLDDKLGKWLPEYTKWSEVTIKSLLNMSSGLPTYEDAGLFISAIAKNPKQQFKGKDLVAFVYTGGDLAPPLKTGYYYTNTGYILLSMIIEKITGHPFDQELVDNTIKPAELKNTFYPVPVMDAAVQQRMAQGYSFDPYGNPELLGKNLKGESLSWAAAAGGVVATTEDVINWVNALFVGDKVLDKALKTDMEQLISLDTGKPLAQPSAQDPAGFGLGVAEAYREDIGRYWFYEGETVSFRAAYLYVPCNDIVVAAAFNSSTDTDNDHFIELLAGSYKSLLKAYPEKQCKS